MKINAKFTHDPVVGSVRRLKGGRRVLDLEGRLLCFLRAGELYDLNLTPFSPCERASTNECLNPEIKGAFVTDGEYLYKDGHVEGIIKDNTVIVIILLFIAFLISLTSFLMLATKMPEPVVYPSFTVVDKDGEWGASGSIDVFGGKTLKPGESGMYMFVVNNPSPANLKCDIIIKFNLENNDKLPPMEYKIFSEGREIIPKVTENGLTVRDAIINKNGNRSFGIEWIWHFESGDDKTDTEIGTAGGKYAMNIEIVAQTA